MLLMSSCSSFNHVAVISENPSNCEFLGTVSTWQCSTGKSGSLKSSRKTLSDLKNEAKKLKGNTLSCCRISEEELVISGVSPKSDEIVCAGMLEHVAEVYSCK